MNCSMACSLLSQLSGAAHFTQNTGRDWTAMPCLIRFNLILAVAILILLLLIYLIKIIMLPRHLLVLFSIYLRIMLFAYLCNDVILL